MCSANHPRPWRIVAEEVSRERDGEKMTALVEELLEALERAKKPEGMISEDVREPHDLSRTA